MKYVPLISAGLLAVSLSLPCQAADAPQTILAMAGVKLPVARLSDGVLIIVDAQREYLDGKLPLVGIDAAIAETAALLGRARRAGTPVIHVVHQGRGGLFEGTTFEIVDALKPQAGETVVRKTYANAFNDTALAEAIASSGRKRLILAGFMTHNCLSSTARAANDRGLPTTVVAAASATRDLPDGRGGVIPAAEVQRASLIGLTDTLAVLVNRQGEIAD